jgi:hypothetical protein
MDYVSIGQRGVGSKKRVYWSSNTKLGVGFIWIFFKKKMTQFSAQQEA